MLGVSMRLPEPLDLSVPLRSYIESNYTKEELASVIPAITNTANLRNRIHASIVRNEADSEASINLFLSYHANLLSLQQHFPFGNTAPAGQSLLGMGLSMAGLKAVKQPTVRCCFAWFESFRHTQKVSDYDIEFELNSVLFDAAALYSRRATSIKGQASSTDDSPIKEACRLFQVSAGLFEHLLHTSTSSASSGLSVDLSADGLSMLTRLMLAQAQACFFEKSTYAASPKLVAKLAMGVTELFKETWRLAAAGRMKSLQQGSADVYQWETHCYYQMLCYNAAAHYWYSKGMLAEDKYGEEIAHLERARLLLEQAAKAEASLLKNLQDNRSKLLSAITTRMQAATRDNETIYYATIPQQAAIRDPDIVVMVKPVPFSPAESTDPYAGLMSPAVRQQADEFKVKLKEMVARMEKESSDSVEGSKQALSSLGLPAALEAEEGEKGVSDEVWSAVQQIQYKGGREALEAGFGRIDIAVREAKGGLQGVVEAIAREKAEDDAMRGQFGSRWVRRTSEQLTAQFQRDVDIVRKYLQEADKSNATVRAELDKNIAQLDALKQTRQQIDARMPHNTQATAQSSAAKRDAAEKLHKLLDELSALIDDRAKVMQDVQAASAKHDIIAVLAGPSARGKPADAVYAEELAKYDVYRERLAALSTRQDALLQDIRSTMAVYDSSSRRETSTAVGQRQAVLQELNDAVRLYERLQANINEGLKFYSDLQTQRIGPLRQRVDDFAVARGMEKQLVLEQITQDIAGYRDDHTTQRNGGIGSPPPAAAAGAAVHPVNPNLNYDHPTQPMYDFSSPVAAGPPARGGGSTPPTNPFADAYAPSPASPPTPSYQQSSYPAYQQQQPAVSPPHPLPYQQQPAPPQQYQQPHPQYQPSYQQAQQPQQRSPQPPVQQYYQPQPQQHNPSSYPGSSSVYPGQYSAAAASHSQAQYAAAPRPAVPAVIACPACTYENPRDARKCEVCETDLTGAATAPPPLPPAAVSSGPPMPQSTRGLFGWQR